jgi:hypothetical protein
MKPDDSNFDIKFKKTLDLNATKTNLEKDTQNTKGKKVNTTTTDKKEDTIP